MTVLTWRSGARSWSAAAIVFIAAVAALTASAGPVAANPVPDVPAAEPSTVSVPHVSGPVTGGRHGFPLASSAIDLRSHGYAEQEFLFSGTATSFTSTQPLTSDGRWTVQPAATAPFTSRMLVRAPIDPHRFNGTVVVEWL